MCVCVYVCVCVCIYIYIYICIYIYIYIYIYEYYSAVKNKNEILPLATTWMDLEYNMLSEISQTEKEKYCILSLTCEI